MNLARAAEMSDLIRQALTRTARKQHVCSACYYKIEVGELHQEQTGFLDGKAFRCRYHNECFDALCEEGEGEYLPGSFEPPERLLHHPTQAEQATKD